MFAMFKGTVIAHPEFHIVTLRSLRWIVIFTYPRHPNGSWADVWIPQTHLKHRTWGGIWKSRAGQFLGDVDLREETIINHMNLSNLTIKPSFFRGGSQWQWQWWTMWPGDLFGFLLVIKSWCALHFCLLTPYIIPKDLLNLLFLGKFTTHIWLIVFL